MKESVTAPPHSFDHRALVARLYRILGIAVAGAGICALVVLGVTWLLSFLVPQAPAIPPNLDVVSTVFYVVAYSPWYAFDGIAWLLREIGLILAPWCAGVVLAGALLHRIGRDLALGLLWARIAAGTIAVALIAAAVVIIAGSPNDTDARVTAAALVALPLYPLWVLGWRFGDETTAAR